MDNTLQESLKLKMDFDIFKIFQHPNGENRRAGASRNLATEKSKLKYIIFLDADDWYLANRFTSENEQFQKPNVDGVYGATWKYSEVTKDFIVYLKTVTKNVRLEDFFYFVLTEVDGFTTDFITMKKTLIKECGSFNEVLRLHQDTHLWYKLMYLGSWYPGILNAPVAIRREHEVNRITSRKRELLLKFHKAVFEDFSEFTDVPNKVMRFLFNRYMHSLSTNKKFILLNYAITLLKHTSYLKYYF